MPTNIYKKLIEVQKELKAPKSQVNKHYNFSYRNQEDILEAVKPLLVKHNLTMFIGDEIKEISGRFYVEATVTLADIDDGFQLSITALAREEDVRKGMDAPQLTGASSSYARKYALNGLFLIDDTKDADSMEHKDIKPVVKPEATKTFATDKCVGCGAGIPANVANFSNTKFGKKLCMNCQGKENK
jgi:hypothetical protein